MLTHPEEVLMNQAEFATTTADEPKSRFKRLTLHFVKDRQQRKLAIKDLKNADENSTHPQRQPFASFFDGKSSLFSKKHPKPDSPSPSLEKPPPVESEWTMV